MLRKLLKSAASFVLMFSLTVFAIAALSGLSGSFGSDGIKPYSAPQAAGADMAQATINVAVNQDKNVLPSILAFSAVCCIPLAYLVLTVKRRRSNPNVFAQNARRYSPKDDVTFGNNSLSLDYVRRRM